MATLQHRYPFGFAESSSQPMLSCRSVGRSLFSFIDSQSDLLEEAADAAPPNRRQNHHHQKQLQQHASHNNSHPLVLAKPFTQASSKRADIVFQQLKDSIGACSSYMHELSEVCSAGVQTAHCLASSLKEAALLTEANQKNCNCSADALLPYETANRFSDAWDQLAIATSGAVASLQEAPFSTLRDSLSQMERRQNGMQGPTVSADESNKILITSLLSMMHLQYQFSLCVCEALVDMVSVTPEELYTGDERDDGTKDPANLFVLCAESLKNMRKHFSHLLGRCHKSASSFGGDLTSECRAECSLSMDADRESATPHEWLRSNSLDSNASATKIDRDDWSSISDVVLSSDLQSDGHRIWQTENVTDSLWSFDDRRSDVKKSNAANAVNAHAFASNEELQDVICLLSRNVSGRSSPASEDSPKSQALAFDAEGTGFLWPSPTKNVPVGGYISMTPLQSAKESDTWACQRNDIAAFLWRNEMEGNSSTVRETTACMKAASSLSCKKSTISSMCHNFNDALRLNENSSMSVTINDCRSHVAAMKSISWPVGDLHAQIGREVVGTLDGFDDTLDRQLVEKNRNFFIGLDLVGTDLMASVRQRRHSSGSSLPETCRAHCSSARTKSIDSIVMEETVLKSSSWTPKDGNSPLETTNGQHRPAVNDRYDRRHSTTASPLWPSEGLQGLPPSGIESRNSHKRERKYSLFGQVTM